MMKYYFKSLSFCCLLILSSLPSHHTLAKSKNDSFAYNELANPAVSNPALWNKVQSVQLGWGSTDVRYKKEAPAGNQVKSINLKAWRGERVAAQFTVSSPEQMDGLHCTIEKLTNIRDSKSIIPADVIHAGFVRYVMTDELNKDGKGGCGHRPNTAAYDSSLVADPIDHHTKMLDLNAKTTQGVWVRVVVPHDIKPGIYKGKVKVSNAVKQLGILDLSVEVSNRELPEPKDWTFYLDLWQNPYSGARVYNTELWSKEHFDAMRPDMELYAKAGGKTITTSIMHKPWDTQTYDYYESMITWMKKADGTWYYDYSVFDKWVEYMMSIGVNKEIACYSLIPWHLTFQYFDQASNSFKYLKTKPGETAFEQHWVGMLKDFATHLKQKGWFDITHIAMDERPMEAMKHTLNVIRKADPMFKVSMAGDYYPELADDLDNYCVAMRHKLDDELKQKRKAAGKVTTYYTCCAEAYPNTFSFSPPAEAEWLGWYSAKVGLEGYLRWALNCWVRAPLEDTRFISWAAGDTYLIYPGGRTSVRFERLTAGIQAYEKIRILKEEFTKSNNQAGLRKLEALLQNFDEKTLSKVPAAVVVAVANKALNNIK